MQPSIHTGGIAFFLTTILGGGAGVVAASVIFLKYVEGEVNSAVAVMLAMGHVTGAAAFGGALGAVASLILFGQTLARCFHLMFAVALAWALAIADYLLLPWIVPRYLLRSQEIATLILLLALPLQLAGLALGQWLSRCTTGFSRRARRRAALGSLVAIVGAMFMPAAFYRLLGLAPWSFQSRDFALLLIPCGAFVGALSGADRTQQRGFGVLPAMPIDDALSTPPPPAQSSERSP